MSGRNRAVRAWLRLDEMLREMGHAAARLPRELRAEWPTVVLLVGVSYGVGVLFLVLDPGALGRGLTAGP
jgi:hypothetical protein